MSTKNTRKLNLGNFGHWAAVKFARACGWDVQGTHPGVDKCVFIACPHTSNWDLLWMFIVALTIRVPIYFMMKHTVFFWPLGALWRMLGGIPVNRTKPAQLVDNLIIEFEAHDAMFLVITPEGTRKPVKYWKSGFYRIAWEAKVPICMAYISYDKKITGVGGTFEPTGDFIKDFEYMRNFYNEKVGYLPDYNPDKLPELKPRR